MNDFNENTAVGISGFGPNKLDIIKRKFSTFKFEDTDGTDGTRVGGADTGAENIAPGIGLNGLLAGAGAGTGEAPAGAGVLDTKF
jgi:hypothetical protein